MTEKLYDRDSYATEFDAVVISCIEHEKGYEIVLDRTLFFPEEGGQCCDKGTLGGVCVTDVQINGDTIYHYCDRPFEKGSTVHGKIDFALRYRNMQNHTGEHILCGIAHKLYGYENVGFHLGDDYVTMDLSGPLTKEQIDELEILANEVVYKNSVVSACYPDKAELDKMFYRCKADIKGDVRIVTIDDCDVCACCAPHVKRTGEVGIIKIIDSFPHRGGERLTILCGFDAFCDYRTKFVQTLKISNLLSVKQNEVSQGVKKLLDDMGKLRHESAEKTKKIASMCVDAIAETDKNICIFNELLDRDSMRIVANGGMKKTKGIIAVLSGNDEDGYAYILGSEKVNLRAIAKEINTALNGKGGGNETMIQGNFNCTKETIEKWFEEFSVDKV